MDILGLSPNLFGVQGDANLSSKVNAQVYAMNNPKKVQVPEKLPLFARIGSSFPQLPNLVVNFSAGIGGIASLGLTNKIRNVMGTNSVVNKESKSYVGGQVAGLTNMAALGRAAIFKAGGATNVLKYRCFNKSSCCRE